MLARHRTANARNLLKDRHQRARRPCRTCLATLGHRRPSAAFSTPVRAAGIVPSSTKHNDGKKSADAKKRVPRRSRRNFLQPRECRESNPTVSKGPVADAQGGQADHREAALGSAMRANARHSSRRVPLLGIHTCFARRRRFEALHDAQPAVAQGQLTRDARVAKARSARDVGQKSF